MAGQTYSKLAEGDRCIIHVDSVNSPTGWWWGEVDSITWKDDHNGGWGSVTAHITGPFQFSPDQFNPRPLYGDAVIKPSVNYGVYPADRETVRLVRWLMDTTDRKDAEIRKLKTRLDEVRGLIKGMGLSIEALRDATHAIRDAAQAVREKHVH